MHFWRASRRALRLIARAWQVFCRSLLDPRYCPACDRSTMVRSCLGSSTPKLVCDTCGIVDAA